MSNIADLMAKAAVTPETTTETPVVETETIEVAPPVAEPVATAPQIDEPQPTTTTAVTEVAPSVTAMAMVNAGVGQVEGEVNNTDLLIPRLQQVHGVGDLAEQFDPGSVILSMGGETTLLVDLPSDKNERRKRSELFEFVPLKAVKVYREYFDFNDASLKDAIPREFLTAADMIKAGCKESYDFPVVGRGNCRPALNLMVAVVRKTADVTDDLAPYFIDEFDDTSICIATWRLQKSAYTSSGKVILTDASRALRRTGLLSARYGAVIEKQQVGENHVWRPVVSLSRQRNSAEFQAFLSELVSG